MASRLFVAEPSLDHMDVASAALRDALNGDLAQDRPEAGLRTAVSWIRSREGELDVMDERRLEMAYGRLIAREAADGPDRMELSSVDYARTLLVDVSLQREGEDALQIMDIFDRERHYSWLNGDHADKPWQRAEVSPSNFMNYAIDELPALASGRFDELHSYHREGVELMLIQGMSSRSDEFDMELHALSTKLSLPDFEQGHIASISDWNQIAARQDRARFGMHPNEGGLTGREIEGVADRIAVARHADLYRDHSMSLYNARPGRNPFEVPDDVAERGTNAARAAMDGHKRSRVEKAVRVALEFQQEHGVSLDRPAFARMERAAGRLIKMPNVGELTDLEAAKALIVDSSVQKIAQEALAGVSREQAFKSPSQRILDDMLGRGSVPTFTRLPAENEDTLAVANGRFASLTDDRGIGSMVRQAIYRSGRDVSGETGTQLERIERSIRIGSVQDQGWIDRKADKSAGASKLQGLSHGPQQRQLAHAREGLDR